MPPRTRSRSGRATGGARAANRWNAWRLPGREEPPMAEPATTPVRRRRPRCRPARRRDADRHRADAPRHRAHADRLAQPLPIDGDPAMTDATHADPWPARTRPAHRRQVTAATGDAGRAPPRPVTGPPPASPTSSRLTGSSPPPASSRPSRSGSRAEGRRRRRRSATSRYARCPTAPSPTSLRRSRGRPASGWSGSRATPRSPTASPRSSPPGWATRAPS